MLSFKPLKILLNNTFDEIANHSYLRKDRDNRIRGDAFQHMSIMNKYNGKSISNQPIPFPIDRDTQDFHALFQYMF